MPRRPAARQRFACTVPRMRVVYDPSHVLHDPVTEVQCGVAMPMYEVPARVESIREALLADDAFSFADPAAHGLGPVTAVHHEGLVSFLADAWGLWRAQGGGSSLPSQFKRSRRRLSSRTGRPVTRAMGSAVSRARRSGLL